ncbi:metal ABC transporter permease [Candidatus Liberibacter sp.]|uniref:metal ABC transporter permease n=1 Tax=Candidatus Liberibacter sp. TaxID=34022 RepID=UPI0015F72659|nr:metal ABC transporter permease [Candidatus Liberibacter sp.]MBA5724200.1 metal ABC transporter permease [Candidatus Liberibacter sp.]
MKSFIDYALFPMTIPTIQNIFSIAIIVVIPMAILSCFIVLRNQSFVGEAISHSVLPGIVIAYMTGIPIMIGAFIAGMTCTLSAGYLKKRSPFREDIILSIVFSGMFALGVILALKVKSEIHFNHVLLGDMLGVSRSNIIISGIVSLFSVAFLLFKKNDLLLQTFDPKYAHSIQISVKFLHYGFLTVLALVIVVSLQSIGIVLPSAVLVLPGATALLISKNHTTMIVIAVAMSIICSIIGIYLSFFINSSPAPTIVLLMAACFSMIYFYSIKKGKNP